MLARANRSVKDAGLHALADALGKAETAVLEANSADVAKAEAAGTSAALIARLRRPRHQAPVLVVEEEPAVLHGGRADDVRAGP